jgi:hypothetical protein
MFLLSSLGCAGAAQEVPPEAWRKRLRDAMMRPVPTRAVRDDQSRLLADAAEQGGMEMLSRDEIRAAFGKGQACRVELCEKNGFGESDWYYEIGEATDDEVKQLPVLIVGFDHHDRAARIWTLTTH